MSRHKTSYKGISGNYNFKELDARLKGDADKSSFVPVKVEENQLQLPTGKIITFNAEQFEGIIKIKNWLKNGQTFFTLAGYAGTGKSTMIKKILDGYRYGVVVLLLRGCLCCEVGRDMSA